MTEFRTNTHDAPKRRRDKKSVRPGQLPEGRLGVYDAKGSLRGVVGRLATAATCRRFGVMDAKFKKGAWRG